MPPTRSNRSYKKIQAKSSSSSSKIELRLPPALLLRILLAFLDNLHDQGGVHIDQKLSHLPSLSLVCKEWARIVRPEYSRWVPVELQTRATRWDGSKQPFGAAAIKQQLRDLRRAHATSGHPSGGLRIALDNPGGASLAERDVVWKRTLDSILLGYQTWPQLEFELTDSESGEYIDIVWRFTQLEKLHLASPRAHSRGKIHLHSPPSSSNSSTTLTRLDLSGLDIVSWRVSFTAIRTLTLSNVRFLPENEGGTTETVSREFFDSFQHLRALGLQGLKDVAPSAFSRFKMFSITHLYLGSCTVDTAGHCSNCVGSDPLLVPLSRYFRPQIKHLILSSNEPSRPLLDCLLSSRSDKPHPNYLKRLESVQIALPPKAVETSCQDHEKYLGDWSVHETKVVKEALTKAKLSHVEVRFWHEIGPIPVGGWDPFY